MRRNSKTRFSRMAALSVAAFVFCFALAGAAHQAHGFTDKKAYQKGYKALRKGDYQQAEKIFRELLVKDAKDIDARLGLSFTLLKQRSLQGAYDNAARVIMLDPLSSRGHALLGASILAAGEFRLSVEEFRTALALNENEALAVAGLAMVDFYENRLPLAIPGLRRAANLDPDEPDYQFNLGQAAARSERYKEAADAYERFLLIAPTDAVGEADLVLLPGFPLSHPDHQWLVRSLVSDFTSDRLALYAEQPYARRAGAAPEVPEWLAAATAVVPFESAPMRLRDRVAKWRAIREYHSQLPLLAMRRSLRRGAHRYAFGPEWIARARN